MANEDELERVDVLFVTALALEFKAVAAHVDLKGEATLPSGTVVETGLFDEHVQVAVIESGVGNESAATVTAEAVQQLKPAYVFFVGVAGGLKDVAIGDVVAANKVYLYDQGKDDGTFRPRADAPESAHALVQRARATARKTAWQSRDGASAAEALVAPIAAGSQVVASTESVSAKRLRELFSDAVAVEMEGGGFLRAVTQFHQRGIVVRGMSDLLDKKSEADESGSQPKAAANAAAFAIEMVAALFPRPAAEGPGEPSFKILHTRFLEFCNDFPPMANIWHVGIGLADDSTFRIPLGELRATSDSLRVQTRNWGGEDFPWASHTATREDRSPTALGFEWAAEGNTATYFYRLDTEGMLLLRETYREDIEKPEVRFLEPGTPIMEKFWLQMRIARSLVWAWKLAMRAGGPTRVVLRFAGLRGRELATIDPRGSHFNRIRSHTSQQEEWIGQVTIYPDSNLVDAARSLYETLMWVFGFERWAESNLPRETADILERCGWSKSG